MIEASPIYQKNAPSIPVKILVVGNSGVGKTSLCNRYLSDQFARAYKPTVGVEFSSKEFTSKKNTKFSFQFWDIGGVYNYKRYKF